MNTTPTSHSPNAVLMLGKRLRRWPKIESTLEKCTMFERKFSAQQTQNICIAFIYRRPNVFNVGPTLYKVRRHIRGHVGGAASSIYVTTMKVHFDRVSVQKAKRGIMETLNLTGMQSEKRHR